MDGVAAMSSDLLERLGELLAYPDEALDAQTAEIASRLHDALPAAASRLEPFVRHVASATRSDLEELYARTFDWSPTRCLEIGWHLHGENYDRGAFLVRMRDLLRRTGLEEGTDLPDNLRLVLAALARLPADEAAGLARDSVRPALARMVAGFGEGKNPYASVIEAVRLVLDATFEIEGGDGCP